jgi:hypothetical protein
VVFCLRPKTRRRIATHTDELTGHRRSYARGVVKEECPRIQITNARLGGKLVTVADGRLAPAAIRVKVGILKLAPECDCTRCRIARQKTKQTILFGQKGRPGSNRIGKLALFAQRPGTLIRELFKRAEYGKN